ncbi:P1 family peptidase [Phycicoccus flavus]|uniref:Peptidase S58 family protein n=1 Tax=Phycicoccus flavus TaxID=2502783 RepID=A0A8T6R825_9MICO|nr:P1 family peptidase [Phycicoccus flavus]NHA70147.1 peptidase S58 family protein [Phycicoccus flavus]
MDAGPHNAVTDVAGVLVGHHTRDEPGWLTGVTVVVPPPGTVGGVDVRGGGPGTRETDLLDPANLVDAVDAVVLAGGSAFGLAACDGVADAVWAAGRGWPVGPGADERVPIVPGAIVFDLGRAGTWRHHPGPADGAAAHAAATGGPVPEGPVGAGTGTRVGGLRGGVGGASVVLASGTTVAALVVANAAGEAVGPDGRLLGAPWLLDDETAALFGPAGPRPPDAAALAAHRERRREEAEALRAGRATTLAVVVTDADLTKAECRRLATVAHDGMARALSPVHTVFDGDTVFSLATGTRPAPAGPDLLELHDAAARCVTRAVVRAVVAGTSVDRTADGGVATPSWRDALPPAG